VELAITSIKTEIDADFRKIQSIKEKLLSLKGSPPRFFEL